MGGVKKMNPLFVGSKLRVLWNCAILSRKGFSGVGPAKAVWMGAHALYAEHWCTVPVPTGVVPPLPRVGVVGFARKLATPPPILGLGNTKKHVLEVNWMVSICPEKGLAMA